MPACKISFLLDTLIHLLHYLSYYASSLSMGSTARMCQRARSPFYWTRSYIFSRRHAPAPRASPCGAAWVGEVLFLQRHTTVAGGAHPPHAARGEVRERRPIGSSLRGGAPRSEARCPAALRGGRRERCLHGSTGVPASIDPASGHLPRPFLRPDPVVEARTRRLRHGHVCLPALPSTPRGVARRKIVGAA